MVPPDLGNLHWDSKLMSCLVSKSTPDDRLPVLLSNQNGIKLLGVPWIPTQCTERIGKLVADATHSLLVQWAVSIALERWCFAQQHPIPDTYTAACIAVQQRLNRQLL